MWAEAASPFGSLSVSHVSRDKGGKKGVAVNLEERDGFERDLEVAVSGRSW